MFHPNRDVAEALRLRDPQKRFFRDVTKRGRADASDVRAERQSEERARKEKPCKARVGITRKRQHAKANRKREGQRGGKREKRRRGDHDERTRDPMLSFTEPRAHREERRDNPKNRSAENRDARELRGWRERGEDPRACRNAWLPNRFAEIEGREPPQEMCILQPKRFVQPELGAEGVSLRRRRFVAEHEGGRIPRQNSERKEHAGREQYEDDRAFERALAKRKENGARATHERDLLVRGSVEDPGVSSVRARIRRACIRARIATGVGPCIGSCVNRRCPRIKDGNARFDRGDGGTSCLANR